MTIYPVIMCGGAGSRLWPASRPGRPKQFLALAGERSLFQDTVLRVAPLAEGRMVVVAGARHADAVAAQLAGIGIEAVILLEPEARDSGPAMAAAAAWIERLDPDGVAAIVASDHHIPDGEAFREAVRIAADEAAHGRIVTLGVTPTSPASAYGYICPAGPGLASVRRFVEKPDRETAARYVAEGFLWNSGNFIVGARTLMEEMAVHAPAIADHARASLPAEGESGPVIRLTDAFRSAPKISIDYAVMEKSGRTSVLPVHFAWSDVGAWDSVLETGRGQAGTHVDMDTEGCLIRAPEGTVVATLGVSNLAVIVEPDAVLVCALDRAQEVKAVVDRVKAVAPAHADIPERRDTAPFARFGDWMRTAALPLWTTLGVHADGAFVEALTLEGRVNETRRRARVQSRQIFSLCRAGALGWGGPWRRAAETGLERFLDGYLRADGTVRNALNPDGTVLDDTVVLYEQAFALLALATAHAAGVHPDRCEARAGVLLDRLEAARPSAGGWRETGDHPFQANANMHLFEAAQAWEARGVDDRWGGVADAIADLALTRLIDGGNGFLREFFDADWRPAAGEDGRIVEPGHQFEWSWLLSRHALARGDGRVMAAAKRLYGHGLRGVDPRRGVAVDQLDDDLKVRSDGARLWPQTEWLRAALAMAALAEGDERQERLDDAAKAMRALHRYLRPNGTWRDKLRGDGGFVDEPAPASSLYHIMGAFDGVCAATRDGLIADGPAGLE